MLKRLTISNYALIDSLDITFPGNLVIITGETGAGKSILLGALSLLLGSKADVSQLGDKSRSCAVEAEFGDETILRRVISPQGRSRAFVNDEPVPLDELRGISSSLVDIHSQHQHLLLSQKSFQISVLDSFAGIVSDVERFASSFDALGDLERELRELDARIERQRRDREYIEFQFRQLDSASLVEGELEELEVEQGRLANIELIAEHITKISSFFEGQSEEDSLDRNLKEVEVSLQKVSSFVPGFADMVQRVSQARIELKDIAYEVSCEGEKLDSSPERLAKVDERLSLIYDLMRKFSVQSVEELMTLRDDYAARLRRQDDDKSAREKLVASIAEHKRACMEEAGRIHKLRSEAAPRLSDEIEKSVRFLEMPLASFEVRCNERSNLDRDGIDDVTFMFSANGRERLEEISKCASGGELSRIMLCLKEMMSRYVGMPTMIFDEIDTGVSGSIAHKMGRMIVNMGHNMQVFAITHLPQVASKGNAHYIVYKEQESSGRIASHIRKIEGDERVKEIARMLSGESLTPEALSNAKVLLEEQ